VKREKIDYRKKITQLKRSKYLTLYRDFNFQYVPQQIGVKTNMNRMFSEREIRNISTANLLIEPTFNKNWYFNRDYSVKWDLTKTLKLNYNSSNKAIIDEPFGRIDDKEKKDSVLTNLKNFGRNTLYSQNVSANYRIPINKFPWTSWVTANAKYVGKYDWQATNPSFVDSTGHNISNSNTRQINGQLNFVSLYNKSQYLKKINRGNKKRPATKKNPKDTTQIKKIKTSLTPQDLINHSVRAMMMVRNISVNYSENNGTFLPGFMGESEVLGMDMNKLFAPGYKFVLGSQDDILTKGIQNDWFNENTNLITQKVAKTNKRNLNTRATLEPIKRFKINLSGTRTLTTNDNFFYEIDSTLSKKYKQNTRVKTQEFSISTNTFRTSFSKMQGNKGSKAYLQMLNNRYIIAKRLAQQNPNWNGQSNPETSFPEGYSAKHHEVLLYSFLSAYRGQSPKDIKMNSSQTPGSTKGFFPSIPIPDWRFNYSGLKKIPIIKKYFKSFSIAHAYKSTLSFNGVQNNIKFDGTGETNSFDDFETNIDFFNFKVSIKETFSPLIKVDMKFHNSILAKMEVKKARTVNLLINAPQVIENHTWDFIIGGGYTIKDLVIPNIEIKGRKLKSDLNLRLDVSVKSTRLTTLTIDGGAQPPSGGLITAIKFSGDYKVSEKVTARAFYDQTINNPHLSTSFPTSTSKGGISIRFTL
jgi:cell surface protein SprA